MLLRTKGQFIVQKLNVCADTDLSMRVYLLHIPLVVPMTVQSTNGHWQYKYSIC